MATLSGTSESVQVANSMVPPGIPGRSSQDFLPKHDPVDARRLLAEAGYPGGVGFPDTVLLTGGSGFDDAIVDEVKRELGITLRSETMADGYFERLSSEAPAMWSLGWVADYPGRNDFLGVLLGTGASNNYGGWSSPAFDAAIAEAVSATDAATAAAAYDRAETVVRDEVPVVPLLYGPGWAISRTGLLGAGQNGLGIVRMAGLAWARLIRRSLALVMAVGLLISVVPVAAAADWATFGTPTATPDYGTGITFEQPVTVTAPAGRVELLLTYADAIGPTIIEVPFPPIAGANTLTHILKTGGQRPPHAEYPDRRPMAARPAPTPTAGVEVGPEVRVVYADDRFDWKTEAGDLVRVHCYKGTEAFGKRALKIAEDAIRDTSKLLGVTETEPVDFYIYADQGAFLEALGPSFTESVGGLAVTSIRTLFTHIAPDQIDAAWIAHVIPHELAHLVFNTAAGNPYHFPPKWLNEGLAEYQSVGYGVDDRNAVRDAVKDGTLIPLDGLVGQFPASSEQFYLAYSESTSAVDFLVRTHGTDALVTLIRSYAEGRTDDEAFTAALGVDTAGFADAWMADIKAPAPTRFGPQPAPPGPVPSAWSGPPIGGVVATPEPIAPSGAPAATAATTPGASPDPAATVGAAEFPFWVPPLFAGIAIVFAVVLLLAARANRRPDRPA